MSQEEVISTPGPVNLTVTNEFGCTASSSFSVIERSNPAIQVGGDKFFCGNSSAELIADPGFVAYLWSTTDTTRTITIKTPGTYRVSVTDGFGCQGIAAATIDTSANTRTGFIQAFLAPYGIGGALIANSTNVTITANSTLAVSITANSLSLSTPLSGINGGTGLSSIANNSLIFGNSTNGFNALALGTSGFVLQSNGTAVVYDTLDGGTF
jgi:hypothetical protein